MQNIIYVNKFRLHYSKIYFEYKHARFVFKIYHFRLIFLIVDKYF
jgi:hypothetical protein